MKHFPIPIRLALGVVVSLWSVSLQAQNLPSVSSGALLLQLEANSGVTIDSTGTNVTSWTDQSPNGFGFNAYTAANIFDPILVSNAQGGQPVIRFLTNGILEGPQIALFQNNNSPLTIFTAFKTAVNTSQGTIVSHEVLEPATTFYGDLELAVNPGTRGTVSAGTFGLNRSLAASSDTTFAPANTNSIITNNVFNVMSTLILSTSTANGSAPQNVEIYKDGVSQTVGAFYGGNNPAYPGWLAAGQYTTGAYELDIGGRLYPTTQAYGAFFIGDIAEVIIYQGTLTPYDRSQVESYLGTKYSVAITPPAALTITTEPLPVAVVNGATASFTVVAGAGDGETDLTYQWQQNGANIPDGTAATLNIALVSAANIGSYQCIVSIPTATNFSETVPLRLITNNTLPSVTSGTLLMHLQADAGVVTDSTGTNVLSWMDQSSNNFDFTTTIFPTTFYPTLATGLTGNPVVHFEGANDIFTPAVQLFTDTNSPVTIFTAYNVHDNSSQRYIIDSPAPRITARAFVDLGVGTSPGNRNEPGSFGIARAAGGATVTQATKVVPNDTFEIGTVAILPSGVAPNNVQLYQNGAFQFVQGYAAGTPDPPYTSTGWLSAGQYQTGVYPFYLGTMQAANTLNFSGAGFWVGDIAEVIIYQGQLSFADQLAVENYLGAKYGIAISSPTLLNFSLQPQSFALTNAGAQTVTFTAGASASTGVTNFTYQWRENGTNIPNATNATLTLTNATIANIGAYQVVASLSSLTVTSDVAALRLVPTADQFSLPPVTSGSLLLQLRSDAGVETDGTGTNVTAWLDQSPNAFVFESQTGVTNAEPNGPGGLIVPPIVATGIIGNPVVRFDGSNDLLCSVPFQLFTDTNSPVTIFTAFSTEENTSQEYLCNLEVIPRTNVYDGETLSANFYNEFMMGVDAGNDGTGEFGAHRASGGATTTPNNLINVNQFYTMCLVIQSNGAAPNNFDIFEDDGLGDETSVPVVGYFTGSGTDPGGKQMGWLSAGLYPTGSYEFHVGASTDSGQATAGVTNAYLGQWNGDIAELIIYQGQLSSADRAAVEGYLNDKYGTGIPHLQIALSGTNTVISWPISLGTGLGGSFLLQSTPSLSPTTWMTVTTPPVASGVNYVLTNGVSGQRYYRMILQ
ncbi:MAG TPA: immunoglobulin domain-containing protein [Verrucomicrobiae bacterium]|nr:immunoglobulin domain-containing protein [Verrucomicrobiae bacterium]